MTNKLIEIFGYPNGWEWLMLCTLCAILGFVFGWINGQAKADREWINTLYKRGLYIRRESE